MSSGLIHGTVENEGCELHYWCQGSGPLLILVPGGGGNGDQYYKLMALMEKRFTVATFDRRQMSSSKVKMNKPCNPAQNARDIIAITKAIGRTKASVFANSGGGILALELAASYPEALEHLILHEVPTIFLLEDATSLMDRCFEILETYRTDGIYVAMGLFSSQFVGVDVPGSTRPDIANLHNWLDNEFLIMSLYCPDLAKIVRNKVSVAVMAGEKSKDAFYARTSIGQAEAMHCPRLMVPGNHFGFDLEAEAFASVLMETLDVMEKSKHQDVLF